MAVKSISSFTFIFIYFRHFISGVGHYETLKRGWDTPITTFWHIHTHTQYLLNPILYFLPKNFNLNLIYFSKLFYYYWKTGRIYHLYYYICCYFNIIKIMNLSHLLLNLPLLLLSGSNHKYLSNQTLYYKCSSNQTLEFVGLLPEILIYYIFFS